MKTTISSQTTVSELHNLMSAAGTDVSAAILLGPDGNSHGTVFFIRDETLAQAVLRALSILAESSPSGLSNYSNLTQ